MILDEIVAHKRQEILARQEATPLSIVRQRAAEADPPRRPAFAAPMSLIAEVKRRSPSKGTLHAALDPVAQARLYERGGAAVISVLTDARYFGGSLADLAAVRRAVRLPVLCKDFILTEYQVYEARAHGADLILLIVAALTDAELLGLQALSRDLGMTPLVEVHDQHNLARAVAAEAGVIGINNRDLRDFSVDLLTTEYLAPLVPDEAVLVSESGMRTHEDVRRVARVGARAVLVGETLMLASDPADAIQSLLA